MSNRRMYLAAGVNGHGYGYGASDDGEGGHARFLRGDYYTRLGEIARAGCFDALFLADHAAMMMGDSTRGDRARIEYTLDPLILMTHIAASVPDIGMIFTASTTYNTPYNLARRLGTMQVLSEGRVAWNVVTSFDEDVAANFNGTLPSTQERYARGAEFIEVMKALWDSWTIDADTLAHGTVAELAATGHPIDHDGTFFQVRGPLNVPSLPYGAPVIVQAGASPSGIRAAAQHADVLFTAQYGLEGALEFSSMVRDGAAETGRRPEDLRIMPGIVPVIGATLEEAHERFAQTLGREAGDDAAAVTFVSTRLGIDAARLDPNKPLTDEQLEFREQGSWPAGFRRAALGIARTENLTVRELTARLRFGHRLVIGTPDTIADAMMEWWEAGAADGWIVLPPRMPDDLQTFVSTVVPILQERDVIPREYTESTLRGRFGLPD